MTNLELIDYLIETSKERKIYLSNGVHKIFYSRPEKITSGHSFKYSMNIMIFNFNCSPVSTEVGFPETFGSKDRLFLYIDDKPVECKYKSLNPLTIFIGCKQKMSYFGHYDVGRFGVRGKNIPGDTDISEYVRNHLS